jgi:hypothetical protein
MNSKRNHNSAEAGSHRTESGQSSYPFQDANRDRYNVPRINDNTVSAEEFPWASTADDPRWDRHVVSATNDQQNSMSRCRRLITKTNETIGQRNALSAGIRSVPWDQWFEVRSPRYEVGGWL